MKKNIDKEKINRVKNKYYSVQYIISAILFTIYFVMSMIHYFRGNEFWIYKLIIFLYVFSLFLLMISLSIEKRSKIILDKSKLRSFLTALTNLIRVLMIATNLIYLFTNSNDLSVLDFIIKLLGVAYIIYSIIIFFISSKKLYKKIKV
ncbi:MAG: hypothetical protein JEZ05_09835 [Tenericutes bacterium]|nr:hypothetical protein [Mycoplasmatota bacterium]